MTFRTVNFVLENLVSKCRTKFKSKFKGNETVCKIESCKSACNEELGVPFSCQCRSKCGCWYEW